MADNDDRKVTLAVADDKGVPTLQSLNEILRQLQMDIYKLEGRLGEATVRDDLKVMGRQTWSGQSTQAGVADAGVIYFDKGLNVFRASEDGGSMVNLIAATPVTHTYHKARVTTVGTQNIADATNTVVDFTDESGASNCYDVGSLHDNAVNPSRLTIVQAGYYHIGTGVIWSDNPNGYRRVDILKNGVSQQYNSMPFAATAITTSNHQVTTQLSLVAGDYIQVQVSQSSTVTLAITNAWFWIHELP